MPSRPQSSFSAPAMAKAWSRAFHLARAGNQREGAAIAENHIAYRHVGHSGLLSERAARRADPFINRSSRLAAGEAGAPRLGNMATHHPPCGMQRGKAAQAFILRRKRGLVLTRGALGLGKPVTAEACRKLPDARQAASLAKTVRPEHSPRKAKNAIAPAIPTITARMTTFIRDALPVRSAGLSRDHGLRGSVTPPAWAITVSPAALSRVASGSRDR